VQNRAEWGVLKPRQTEILGLLIMQYFLESDTAGACMDPLQEKFKLENETSAAIVDLELLITKLVASQDFKCFEC